MKSINEIIWDFENSATTQDTAEMYCGNSSGNGGSSNTGEHS